MVVLPCFVIIYKALKDDDLTTALNFFPLIIFVHYSISIAVRALFSIFEPRYSYSSQAPITSPSFVSSLSAQLFDFCSVPVLIFIGQYFTHEFEALPLFNVIEFFFHLVVCLFHSKLFTNFLKLCYVGKCSNSKFPISIVIQIDDSCFTAVTTLAFIEDLSTIFEPGHFRLYKIYK